MVSSLQQKSKKFIHKCQITHPAEQNKNQNSRSFAVQNSLVFTIQYIIQRLAYNSCKVNQSQLCSMSVIN